MCIVYAHEKYNEINLKNCKKIKGEVVGRRDKKEYFRSEHDQNKFYT
jgi:hypothetical protein